MRFAILVDKKRDVVYMNQLENCQARYRSNTWMGRSRTEGPDEFEPTKFDCIAIVSLGLTYQVRIKTLALTVFKKSTFQTNSHLNALESKLDLDQK